MTGVNDLVSCTLLTHQSVPLRLTFSDRRTSQSVLAQEVTPHRPLDTSLYVLH